MTTMIKVDNATKAFTLSYQRSLKQTVLAKARGRKTHDTFNAVDDVTFSVHEGEAVAAQHLPDHLFTRGLIMLAISLVLLVLAQRLFSRLEARVPERL